MGSSCSSFVGSFYCWASNYLSIIRVCTVNLKSRPVDWYNWCRSTYSTCYASQCNVVVQTHRQHSGAVASDLSAAVFQ